MRIVQDDLWLCVECMTIAVNGDASGLDYSYGPEEAAARLVTIETGLARLGPHLVTHWDDSEDEDNDDGKEEEIGAWVTRQPCACCRDHHHGSRYRFAILGESGPTAT